MSVKKFLIPALASMVLATGMATPSDAAYRTRTVHKTVVHRGHRTIVRTNTRVVVRRPGRVFLPRDRAVVFFRARPGIRYVGAPYIYGNYYVERCYDPVTGALAYCRIDPYTGAWLGVTLRL